MLYTTQKETAELLNIMLPKLCNIFTARYIKLGKQHPHLCFAVNIYQTSSLYKKISARKSLSNSNKSKRKKNTLKSPAYQRLLKEGYSNKQIKYLNCILPTLFPNENSLDLKGLSYTKNLVEYCKSA